MSPEANETANVPVTNDNVILDKISNGAVTPAANLSTPHEAPKYQGKKATIANCFFIQKAAIDILLLHKATAIEICAYLVICKYTDKYGFLSGVGYQTIKERLGIGQRKAEEAIHRLTQMKWKGHRLLYHVDEWVKKKLKDAAVEIKTGWVRPWINSNYEHNIWINNSLVGNHKSTDRPLNYFCKTDSRDAHANLLILLLKFYTKSYSAVNYKLASIATNLAEKHDLPAYALNRSRISGYAISTLIPVAIWQNSKQPVDQILKDLVNNHFFYIDLLVLTDAKRKVIKRKRKRSVLTAEPEKSPPRFFWLKTELNDDGSVLIRRVKTKNIKDYIDLSEWVQMPLIRLLKGVREELKFSQPAQYAYRVDVKNISGKPAKPKNCLAAKIKALAIKQGLATASKRTIFRNEYWWIAPNRNTCHLVGVFASNYVHATRQKNRSEMTSFIRNSSPKNTPDDNSDIF